MKKFFKHIGMLLVGILLVCLIGSVDLKHTSFGEITNFIFWPIISVILALVLIYYYRGKMCLLLLCSLLTFSCIAAEHTQEICTYYHQYKAEIDQAERDNWKSGDKPCDAEKWEWARQEAEEYKLSWKQAIVAPGAGYIYNQVNEWLDNSCANALMKYCSAYEKRHPETVTKTVPVILNETIGRAKAGSKPSACWPCDMAYIVFTVIQSLSANLYDTMTEVARNLLIICALIWLLVKGASMAVLPSKGTTFFAEIIGGVIGCIIAALILTHSEGLSTLYSKVLSPVMQIGVGMSDKILETVGPDSQYYAGLATAGPFNERLETKSKAALASSGIAETKFIDYCESVSSTGTTASTGSGITIPSVLADFFKNISGWTFPSLETDFPKLGNVDASKTLLDDSLKAKFLCSTQKFYYQSRPFIAAGQSLISFANHDTKGFKGVRWPGNLCMWFVGIFLVAIFTYYGFLVAFRIMDIFLRLGFGMILMPVFVATAVFPMTRGFTKKGWNFIFQVIVEFIGLAMAISFSMIMLEKVIAPNTDELIDAMAASYTKDYGENLLKAITHQMTWMTPLMLLVVVLMGNTLMKNFASIINGLFGVGIPGKDSALFGPTVTGFGAKTMGLYQQAKGAAKSMSQNPYKTKRTQANEAKTDLKNKEKKLNEAKANAAKMKGTPQALSAEAALKKAQEDYNQSKLTSEHLNRVAEAEENKTSKSTSSYAARRFGYNAGNAVRKAGAGTAQAVDTAGSKVGGLLIKTGVGAIVGVPIVFAAKGLSLGVRTGAKITEVGLKAAGRFGATVQKIGDKVTGKKRP